MLAALTPDHSLAWDVGTGNGQAVAEHYKQEIATDISEEQLKRAIPHPRVHYLQTPLTMSDDELVHLLGGENSVDLITVASAVHWFDLEKFYPIVKRVLRKPGGHALECYKTLPFPFESVVQELESARGGPEVVRTVIYKTYMLAGKCGMS
ncbi:hypothetical protein NC652_019473 [Populus alba x Populus x berolinensis]|nr:hypothetical protein NC652_019473 [Populus alba x Populus x berolinensis]